MKWFTVHIGILLNILVIVAPVPVGVVGWSVFSDIAPQLLTSFEGPLNV